MASLANPSCGKDSQMDPLFMRFSPKKWNLNGIYQSIIDFLVKSGFSFLRRQTLDSLCARLEQDYYIFKI